MPDAVVLGLAFAVCAVPGSAVLLALGVRRPLLLLALSAPASAAVAGATSVLTGLIGIGFGAAAMAVITLLLLVVAGLRAARRRDARTPAPMTSTASPARPVLFGGSARVGTAAGVALAAAGVVIGAASWLRALGGLATYPQEHDTIVHTLLTAYISRTGRAAPWELLPVDVLTGGPVYFYPAGMHLLAGAVADLTGDAVAAFNAVTVVLLAVVLSTSAAVLAWVAARRMEVGPAGAALAGGVASLVAAGLYRPTIQLAHDGGGLPNAAALAMTPALVAALLVLASSPRRVALAVGIASAGAVWVHPNVAISVSVTALAWWVGDAAVRRGRAELRRLPVRLLLAGGVAAVLLVPFVLSSASAVARTSAFPADTPPAGLSVAVGSTLSLAYGGYIDPERTTGQLVAAVLVAVGLAAVLVRRRGYGVVAAWGVWTAIAIAYFLSPDTGPETIVTSFFYKAMVRVWSHVNLVVPVLVALGVVLVAARLAVLLRRRTPAPPAGVVAAVLVVLVAVGYAVGPGRSYVEANTAALTTRYSEPDFVRVGPDDRRAADWLAERVRPGERVLNSPNDGSTILYVEHGIPVVNVYPLGLPQAEYSYELLDSFHRYPVDAAIRDMLVDLDVAWVYVDSQAPTIGAAGSPEDWAGAGIFDLAPGLQGLDGLPGLQEEYRSGSVRVYALDLDLLRNWDP